MGKTPRSIVVILLIFLSAPLLASLLRGKAENNDENRRLSPKPAFSLLGFASQDYRTAWESYYRDNFGLRDLLVRGNFLVHHRLLKDSPTNKVIVGKDGWLFYTGDGELNDYRGITQYSENQLKAWVEMLELKRNWLKKKGIEYIYVIAPNKSTIYPEYMPNNYTRVSRQSGLDQFLVYVKKNSTLQVLDLREDLVSSKGSAQLYCKTDTHWNNYGAFVAYQSLMKAISIHLPNSEPVPINRFTITIKSDDGGDLAKMMGGTKFLKDTNVIFMSKKTPQYSMVETDNKKITCYFPNKKLPRALIFRDSFFSAMIPFIAEHFSESLYVWDRWGTQTAMEEIVANHKPHIVIEEVLERYIKSDYALFLNKTPIYIK